MDIFDQVELGDCTLCGGAGLFEEEGNSFYATCMDCGSRSVNVSYSTEEGKLEALKRVAMLWDSGKVLNSNPGE